MPKPPRSAVLPSPVRVVGKADARRGSDRLLMVRLERDAVRAQQLHAMAGSPVFGTNRPMYATGATVLFAGSIATRLPALVPGI